MIRFEQGSGEYDAVAKMFFFRAVDVGEPVTCVVSRQAFELLTGDRVHSKTADRLFQKWERSVFLAAQRKYITAGLNEQGALTLSAFDLAQIMVH